MSPTLVAGLDRRCGLRSVNGRQGVPIRGRSARAVRYFYHIIAQLGGEERTPPYAMDTIALALLSLFLLFTLKRCLDYRAAVKSIRYVLQLLCTSGALTVGTVTTLALAR